MTAPITPVATKAEVGEGGGDEAEVEERHQIACAHHVDDHCITDNHDHTAGDVQTAGDHFRDSIQQALNFAGADGNRHDNGRDSDTHRLQEQGRDVQPRQGGQVAILRRFIRRVLEGHGDGAHDDGQHRLPPPAG